MMCTYYKRCVIIIREIVNTNTTGPCNSRGQTFFFFGKWYNTFCMFITIITVTFP